MASVYMQDGERLGPRSETLLMLLSAYLNQAKMRWVAGGDWNMTPDILACSGLLRLTGGSLRATG